MGDISVKSNINLFGNIAKDIQTQLTRVVFANESAVPKTFKRADNQKEIKLSTTLADDVGRMLYCVTDNCVYVFKYISANTYDWVPISNATMTADNLEVVDSGGGNAVTNLSINFDNGKALITETKSTFLTSHQAVVNKDATLKYNASQTIAKIGNTDITAKSKATIVNGSQNLQWGTDVTIATIDDQIITAQLPTDPSAQVSNKDVTLAWGTRSTIATIDSTNITAQLPTNPNTINEFKNRAIIGANDTTMQGLINTYANNIFDAIECGVTHFDLFNTSDSPLFSVIGLGADYLLSLMTSMYASIQAYYSTIGVTDISREIVFHFKMTIPSVSSIDDSFIHISFATYNSTTKSFIAQGTIYDTQLMDYYNLTHTTSGQLFNFLDIQIKFTFGTSIDDGSIIYCTMTPTITLI